MVASAIHDQDSRLRSYEILAEAARSIDATPPGLVAA
jgi:hypothetical protein